ncbi:MAG: hypothetical protein KY456_03440 [Chloroflexi bacterium]|nr:hypothetical protein [Chloroflexota bacterium]
MAGLGLSMMLRRRPPLVACDDEEDEIEQLPFTALRGSLESSPVTANETRADPLRLVPRADFLATNTQNHNLPSVLLTSSAFESDVQKAEAFD